MFDLQPTSFYYFTFSGIDSTALSVLKMEPSPNAPSSGRKRKNLSSTGLGKSKRLKTEKQEVEAVECERPSSSPKVSVLFDCLKQPITLKELTSLLHYVALGKGGGIKKPR